MAFPVDANAHDAVVGLPGLAHKGPHIAAPDLHQPRLYHLLPRLGGFRHELSTLRVIVAYARGAEESSIRKLAVEVWLKDMP